MLGLNIGSGQRKFTSTDNMTWIDIDSNPKWSPDIVADGASLPMFRDAEADYIVSHHCIEHVGLGEFDATIREAHRILKPLGSLIITTPDLDALIDAWREGRIDNYIFCVNLYGAYQDNEADRHKWLYTKTTLKQSVRKAASWYTVIPFDWRSIEGSDIAKDWWIQGLEAVK